MRVWYVGVRVMLVTPSVGSMQMCKDEQQRARMQHSIESASGHLLLGDSLLLLRDSLCRPAAGTATQTCFRGSYRQPAAHGRVDKLLQMKGRTQTRDQSRAGGVERKRRQATGTGGRRKAARRPAAAARRREERSDYEAMGRLVTSSSMGGGDVTRT